MKTHTEFPNSSVKGSSASRVSARGFQVLGLACEERAIRLDLAARIMGVRPSGLASVVGRLEDAGLVKQEQFLVKERYPWIWPTKAGLRLDERGYPFYKPALGQLQHMAGVASTRALCLGSDSAAVWVPERALMREHSRRKRHLADAALEIGGRRIAVEVELTGKDRNKVVANMAALVRDFGGARYYCSSRTRAAVQAAVAVGGFTGVEVLDAPAFV
jgi:DNA-binding MarR family transcriptional regulator